MVKYMLLEFGVSNYKSFKDRMLFSMVPALKQKGLDYSILTEVINKKTFKALCSSVVYGPNASGKSNIIGAMDTFKKIVCAVISVIVLISLIRIKLLVCWN